MNRPIPESAQTYARNDCVALLADYIWIRVAHGDAAVIQKQGQLRLVGQRPHAGNRVTPSNLPQS